MDANRSNRAIKLRLITEALLNARGCQRCTPPLGPVSFIHCSFWQKIAKNGLLLPPMMPPSMWEVLDSPLEDEILPCFLYWW